MHGNSSQFPNVDISLLFNLAFSIIRFIQDLSNYICNIVVDY